MPRTTTPKQSSPHVMAVPSTSLTLGPLTISFQRTCRVPQRLDRPNALPAGLGTFPIYNTDDFHGNVPAEWKSGSKFIPVFEHEALWINFERPAAPVALLIAAGMVNAITGEKLVEGLSSEPQDYATIPPTPWIDGWKGTDGHTVRQFVAARLGSGETAEEQILGTAEFGGIQFGVYESILNLLPQPSPNEFLVAGSAPSAGGSGGWAMAAPGGFDTLTISSSYPSAPKYYRGSGMTGQSLGANVNFASVASYNTAGPTPAFGAGQQAQAMGLGAGGSIEQKIYPDPYLQGRKVSDVWRDVPTAKGYIYLVSALDFRAITGHDAPPTPVSYKDYQTHGYPWYLLPDGTWGDVPGGAPIEGLVPVSGGPDINGNIVGKDLW